MAGRGPARFGAIEAAQDLLAFGFRHAGPLIGDADDRPAAFAGRRDLDPPAAVEDGVLDQVGQGLLDKSRVGLDRSCRGKSDGQPPARLFDEGAVDVGHGAGQDGEIQPFSLQGGDAALDPGQGQQGLEQGADLIRLLQRAFDGGLARLGVVQIGGQVFQPMADPAQRRAQFVGHALGQGLQRRQRRLLPVQHPVEVGRQLVELAPQADGGQAGRILTGDDASDRLIDALKPP